MSQRATNEVLFRLGRLPAVLVGFALYGLTAAAVLLLSKGAGEGIGLGFLAVSVLYCFARPHGGEQVWGWLMLPTIVATLMKIIDTPRWIGLLFIPVTLLGLWFEDRKTPSSGSKAP